MDPRHKERAERLLKNKCKADEPIQRNFKTLIKVKAYVFDKVKKLWAKDLIKTDPFGTAVIKAHQVFMSTFLGMLFVFSQSLWYSETPMVCVDKFDRRLPPEDLSRHCYYFPYKETKIPGTYNQSHRIYVTHYVWIPLTFLATSVIFKLLAFWRKLFHNANLREMLEEMQETTMDKYLGIAKYYFVTKKGMHSGIYWKCVFLHVIALITNVGNFIIFDALLQERYWDLPKNLAVLRDPKNFDDSYSLIFPPFTDCEITPDHHILIETTKKYGCHLTMMELYEKILMILWFAQMILAIWTIIYILYLLQLKFAKIRFLGIGASLLPYDARNNIKKMSTDELLALGSVKDLLFGTEYVRLLDDLQKDLSDCPYDVVSSEDFRLNQSNTSEVFELSLLNPANDSDSDHSTNDLANKSVHRRGSTGFTSEDKLNIQVNLDTTKFYTRPQKKSSSSTTTTTTSSNGITRNNKIGWNFSQNPLSSLRNVNANKNNGPKKTPFTRSFSTNKSYKPSAPPAHTAPSRACDDEDDEEWYK